MGGLTPTPPLAYALGSDAPSLLFFLLNLLREIWSDLTEFSLLRLCAAWHARWLLMLTVRAADLFVFK